MTHRFRMNGERNMRLFPYGDDSRFSMSPQSCMKECHFGAGMEAMTGAVGVSRVARLGSPQEHHRCCAGIFRMNEM